MNPEKLVKFTNQLAVILVAALLYWVYTFILITVFGLKVFRQNTTEIYYFSVLGILALLSGAVIVNVMLNLTRISDTLNNKGKTPEKTAKKNKWLLPAFLLSFVLIPGLLFLGNYNSSVIKKNMLMTAAKNIQKENADIVRKLSQYSFDSRYLTSAGEMLQLISREEQSFNAVSLIVQDTIRDKQVYLRIDRFSYNRSDKNETPSKINYVFSSSKKVREYLNSVFNKGNMGINYSAHKGNYELFFPVKTNSGVIIFYFTDYQEYGKFSS
jgi:hypothetical protein